MIRSIIIRRKYVELNIKVLGTVKRVHHGKEITHDVNMPNASGTIGLPYLANEVALFGRIVSEDESQTGGKANEQSLLLEGSVASNGGQRV